MVSIARAFGCASPVADAPLPLALPSRIARPAPYRPILKTEQSGTSRSACTRRAAWSPLCNNMPVMEQSGTGWLRPFGCRSESGDWSGV